MTGSALSFTGTLAGVELDSPTDRIVGRVLEQLPVETPSPWMSLDTAAAYLDWPKKRVYNLVSQGEIPHRKQGNRLLFHRGELDEWLNSYYQGPSEFAS
jgi:excisionase family DNA binding protein